MSTATESRELLGREPQLARLEAFLDRLADGPSALVLEGEPGIGKTELWRAGCTAARGRAYRVLDARPAEAEDALAFAGLADLLAGAHDEIEALPPPQRRALAVALLLEEPGGAPPDPHAIAVAALAVLRALAVQQPLLVAVDDVQWLDRASGAALAFALRRLKGEHIGALLAQRVGGADRLPLDPALEPERIEVGPLSFGATQRLLHERFGRRWSRSTVRRIHERSGGNAFFALELARALAARGADSVAPREELPVPADLGRLLQQRLSELPPGSAEPLAAVAALAEPPFALVADEVALEPAFAAGVLVLDGDRVRFSHPLLAAAAYDSLTPQRRLALHRRLADVVAGPEERARHLALAAAGPDPELAGMLDAAAEHSIARGAPHAAAELVEHALRLDGAAEPDAAIRRVLAAARFHMLAGDDRRARALLEGALAGAAAGVGRAQLRHALGMSFIDTDLVRARAELEAAVTETGGDERLEAQVRGDLGALLTVALRPADGEPHLRASVEAAERVGDPGPLARALGFLAVCIFTQGRGVDARLMERALALEPECDSLRIGERPVTRFGWMCKHAGDVDRSRLLLAEARRIGEERGDSGVGEPLFYSCYLELYADSWRRGVQLADHACELGRETERDDMLRAALCARATLLAYLGDEAGARRDAAEGVALDEIVGSPQGALLAGMALSTLELSLDRPAEALAAARPTTDIYRSIGIEEPGLHLSFPVHAEAAIATGGVEEAEELLGWIEERAARLDREWALACAARCRGLLAAARGDEAAAVAAFERALAEHGRVQYRRFDLARTLLAQGETLRRFKRKARAREAIHGAVEIFDELGAALWAAKARRELARISGRRTAEGLTETERRVAELVAAGRSNKEVAGELFVTVRTVEANLTRVYAKLGVRSRTELPGRLSA